jgi:hypothetical protein
MKIVDTIYIEEEISRLLMDLISAREVMVQPIIHEHLISHSAEINNKP